MLLPETVLWGIYYSSATDAMNQQLIEQTMSLENRSHRCALGFLISWNGFTETVTKEKLRGSREQIMLVPNQEALRDLTSRVYLELRRMAAKYMREERSGDSSAGNCASPRSLFAAGGSGQCQLAGSRAFLRRVGKHDEADPGGSSPRK